MDKDLSWGCVQSGLGAQRSGSGETPGKDRAKEREGLLDHLGQGGVRAAGERGSEATRCGGAGGEREREQESESGGARGCRRSGSPGQGQAAEGETEGDRVVALKQFTVYFQDLFSMKH